MIALAPSGSGKSPACHHGCINPIVDHLEKKIDSGILLYVASANGMFNHFVSGKTVPILCVDEVHSLLTKVFYPSKSSQVDLTMERLCKLFDGYLGKLFGETGPSIMACGHVGTKFGSILPVTEEHRSTWRLCWYPKVETYKRLLWPAVEKERDRNISQALQGTKKAWPPPATKMG